MVDDAGKPAAARAATASSAGALACEGALAPPAAVGKRVTFLERCAAAMTAPSSGGGRLQVCAQRRSTDDEVGRAVPIAHCRAQSCCSTAAVAGGDGLGWQDGVKRPLT